MRNEAKTLPIPEEVLRHLLQDEPLIVEYLGPEDLVDDEADELFIDVELFPEP